MELGEVIKKGVSFWSITLFVGLHPNSERVVARQRCEEENPKVCEDIELASFGGLSVSTSLEGYEVRTPISRGWWVFEFGHSGLPVWGHLSVYQLHPKEVTKSWLQQHKDVVPEVEDFE